MHDVPGHPHPPRLGRRDALRLLAATPAAILMATPGCCHLVEPRATEDDAPDDDASSATDTGTGTGTDAATNAPWRREPPSHEPLVRIRVGSVPADATIRIGASGESVLIDRPAAPVLTSATDEDAPDLDVRSRTFGEATMLRGPVEIARDDARPGWTWRDAAGRSGRWLDPGASGVPGEPPAALGLARPRPDVGDAAVGGAPASELRGPIDWNGIPWPGRLRLVAGAERTHIVAVVPMETYIPGVLAREIFPGWRDATFAAQAVAARSFATFAVLERADRPWDVEADQRSQMFAGRTKLPAAIAAGAATTGLLLTYDGGVLPAYYSSTCGGIGMPARLAIGPAPVNALPPFAGHALDCCRDAPRFRWTASRTPARLRAQLRAWGTARNRPDLAAIGPIREIRVATRTSDGRPTSFEFRHGAASTDAGGGPARVRLDAPQLRRALQTGRREGEAPVWSSFMEPRLDPRTGRIDLRGRGWGHGAGLCQYGAEELARRGLTAEEILAAYFPGAALTRGWTAPPAATT